MKNCVGLRKRDLPHKHHLSHNYAWKAGKIDSSMWWWQMHTGQISLHPKDTKNPSWPCPAPSGASLHTAPATLCEWPFLSPGWASWTYTVGSSPVPFPVCPQLCSWRDPSCYKSKPLPPHVHPPQDCASLVRTETVKGHPQLDPSWGSFSLSSPSHSWLRPVWNTETHSSTSDMNTPVDLSSYAMFD